MKRSTRTSQAGILLLCILLLCILFLFAFNFYKNTSAPITGNNGGKTIEHAFENRTSNIQLTGIGTITKLLPDDTKGTKHQRFIVRISPKVTVLIAHNIDLAPRINNIGQGDTLSFYGEYEWNNRGGVIHWTHRDPGKRHIDGWLKFRGKTYQ
jgi:hypothetical protein